jgi:hypothetical protein
MVARAFRVEWKREDGGYAGSSWRKESWPVRFRHSVAAWRQCRNDVGSALWWGERLAGFIAWGGSCEGFEFPYSKSVPDSRNLRSVPHFRKKCQTTTGSAKRCKAGLPVPATQSGRA